MIIGVFALLLIAVLYFILNVLHYRRLCNCQPRVGNSGVAGKGVFASRPYSSGDHIDQCSTIAIDYSHIAGKSILQDYVFQSSEPQSGMVLVPLGSCGLYNHSDYSNATYTISPQGTIDVFASRNIASGEEIFVNYGNGYWKSRGISPV